MDAPDDVGGPSCQAFAAKIKPLLLSVGCPTFLNHVCRFGVGDAESND